MTFSFKWNLLSYKTGTIPKCLVFVGFTLQSQHLIGLWIWFINIFSGSEDVIFWYPVHFFQNLTASLQVGTSIVRYVW